MSAAVGPWVRFLRIRRFPYGCISSVRTVNDAIKALATDRLAQIIMTDKENEKAQSRSTVDVRSYALFRSDAGPCSPGRDKEAIQEELTVATAGCHTLGLNYFWGVRTAGTCNGTRKLLARM
jgi:hypothetical protein